MNILDMKVMVIKNRNLSLYKNLNQTEPYLRNIVIHFQILIYRKSS